MIRLLAGRDRPARWGFQSGSSRRELRVSPEMGKDRVEGDFKAGKIDQKEYEIRKDQITCGSFF
jgi:hypothetical protein